MSKHQTHEMHEHSIEGYHEERDRGRLSKRVAMILETCLSSAAALTDREITRRLGFTDGNSVKPRITEMIQEGLLRETGSITDPFTGKTVRLVRPANPRPAEKQQGRLF